MKNFDITKIAAAISVLKATWDAIVTVADFLTKVVLGS